MTKQEIELQIEFINGTLKQMMDKAERLHQQRKDLERALEELEEK